MRYRADITAGALKVPESRIIADLLLRGLNEAGWQDAIYGQNVLQTRSPKTAARLTLLLRGRLTLMDANLWTLVRDGSGTVELPGLAAVASPLRQVRAVEREHLYPIVVEIGDIRVTRRIESNAPWFVELAAPAAGRTERSEE